MGTGNAENEFRQSIKRVVARQDGKYQAKPGPYLQADITDVNQDAGTVTIQAQGQPATVFVGANTALMKKGDQWLAQQQNTSATDPQYALIMPLKQDLIRTNFADPNPDLAVPEGLSITPGTSQPSPGGYQAYADVVLHTITSNYNYYTDGVTCFHVHKKLDTDLAWDAPAIVDMPSARPVGVLAAAIGAGDTTITFSRIGGTPAYQGRAQIEGERVDYTSLSVASDTYTLHGCTRGVDGTVAASHAYFTPILFHSVSARISGLAVNHGYDFKVAAVKGEWEGPQTEVISITTPLDLTAPATPTGIQVVLQRSGAQVSWNPVTDAKIGVGGYYEVFRNTSPSTSGATSHRTASTSWFWGNNDGAGWWFGVRAVSSADVPSGSIWGQDTIPPDPADDFVVTNQPGSIHFHITPPTVAEDIVGYIIYQADDSVGSVNVSEVVRLPVDTLDYDYIIGQGTSLWFNVKTYDISGQTSIYNNWTPGTSEYLQQLNYVRNGTFEHQSSNWQFGVDHGAGLNFDILQLYGIAYEGTGGQAGPSGLEGAGMARIPTGLLQANHLYQWVPLRGAKQLAPTSHYTFSYFWKTASIVGLPNDAIGVYLKFYDSSWTLLSTKTILPDLASAQAGQWQRVVYDAEASGSTNIVPNGAVFIKVEAFANGEPNGGSGATSDVYFSGFLLNAGDFVIAYAPFVIPTTESHQIQNLLPNTWINDTSGWNLLRATRITSGFPAEQCPTAPNAMMKLDGTTGQATASYTVTRPFVRGMFLTESLWVYTTSPSSSSYLMLRDTGGSIILGATTIPAVAANTWYKLIFTCFLPSNVNYSGGIQVLIVAASGTIVYAASPKLEVGNQGTDYTPQFLGKEEFEGATFPGGPTSGLPFFRTDLRTLYAYDGTRWLSHEMPLLHLVSLTNAATTNLGHTYLVRQTYLTYWAFTVFVATTNNASNYWTIKLTDGTSVFAQFSTNGSAANVNIPQTISSFSPNPLSTGNTIYIRLEKTGSPGTIDYYGGLRIREVGT